VERLVRLELLEFKNGKYKRTPNALKTSDGFASRALRLSHEQSLRQAIDALAEVSLESRDITSITMAIDPRKIEGAKKLIRDFRRKISEYLEAGEATEVYNLNIQLVPVTKLEQGREV
jgi:uncharacterized protein (TIGR02147 family)